MTVRQTHVDPPVEATAAVVDAATSHAIERLVLLHAHLLDRGRSEEVPDLYTEDGCMLGLAALGLGDDLVGREAIRAWARRRGQTAHLVTRHVCTNFLVTTATATTAQATSVVVLYRAEGAAPADRLTEGRPRWWPATTTSGCAVTRTPDGVCRSAASSRRC